MNINFPNTIGLMVFEIKAIYKSFEKEFKMIFRFIQRTRLEINCKNIPFCLSVINLTSSENIYSVHVYIHLETLKKHFFYKIQYMHGMIYLFCNACTHSIYIALLTVLEY